MPIFIPTGNSAVVTVAAGNGNSVSIPIAASNNLVKETNCTGFLIALWFYVPTPAAPGNGDYAYTRITSNLANFSNAAYGPELIVKATVTVQANYNGSNTPMQRTTSGANSFVVQVDNMTMVSVAASASPLSLSWPAFTCTGSLLSVKNQITFNYQVKMVTK